MTTEKTSKLQSAVVKHPKKGTEPLAKTNRVNVELGALRNWPEDLIAIARNVRDALNTSVDVESMKRNISLKVAGSLERLDKVIAALIECRYLSFIPDLLVEYVIAMNFTDSKDCLCSECRYDPTLPYRERIKAAESARPTS